MSFINPTAQGIEPSSSLQRTLDAMAQRFLVPHETTTRVTGLSTATSTTGSYLNIPGTRVQIVDFVKYRDDTKLVITCSGSAVQTVAGANIFYGVTFNGTDQDVATIQTASGTRLPAVGTREFTGVIKGTYLVEMRLKISAGTWTPDATADSFCLTARETF